MWLGLWHKSQLAVLSAASVSSDPPGCCSISLKWTLMSWSFDFFVAYYELIIFSKCSNSISKCQDTPEPPSLPLSPQPYQFTRPSLSLHQFLLIYSLIISKHKPAQTCNKTWTAHNFARIGRGRELPRGKILRAHPLPSFSSISPSFLLAASVDSMSVPDVNTDWIYY